MTTPPPASGGTLTPPPPPPSSAPPAEATPGARIPVRVLTRRPGLPGGRAVLGALLVVTAGVGTFSLAGADDGTPTVDYPVLVRPVDPGRPITVDDVAWRPMVLDDDVATRTVIDPRDLDDAVALVPLSAGQLLQRGEFVARDDAPGATGTTLQLSLPVPIDRTPPALRRGERVALLATYGSGADATTVVTVQSATVLGYETDPDAIGGHDTGRLTINLEDPAALMASAHASQVAELTVVRTTVATVTLPDRFGAIDPDGGRS